MKEVKEVKVNIEDLDMSNYKLVDETNSSQVWALKQNNQKIRLLITIRDLRIEFLDQETKSMWCIIDPHTQELIDNMFDGSNKTLPRPNWSGGYLSIGTRSIWPMKKILRGDFIDVVAEYNGIDFCMGKWNHSLNVLQFRNTHPEEKNYFAD